jgi:hypothetical protein
LDNAWALRDPAKTRDEVLNSLLVSGSRQLEESTKNIEEIKSILNWAKSPSERTTINIIFDDQKKVIKALERLVGDLAETIGEK